MAQAIPLLRKCTVEGKSFTLLDDSKKPVSEIKSATTVSFPDTPTPFPLSAPSGYKTYPLQSIVFFLENKDVSFAEYFQLCLQNDVVQVSLTDRKELLGYLVGTNETLPNYIAVVDALAPSAVAAKDATSTTAAAPVAGKAVSELPKQDKISDLGKRAAEDVLMKDVGDLGVEDVFKKSRLLDSVVIGGNDAEMVKKIVAKERTIQNRQTVLQVKSGKTFAGIQKYGYSIYTQHFLHQQDPNKKVDPNASSSRHPQKPSSSSSSSSRKAVPSSSSSSSRHKSSSSAAASSSSANAKRKDPIIIIPNAPTSLLSMYNIKDFLEEQTFKPTTHYLATNTPKPTDVFIRRAKPDGTFYNFRIVDSVSRFKTSEDWRRVVAVFAFGQDWQFRDYKWSQPVDLFHRVRGFHLQYADEGTNPAVAKWNVHVLRIHRERRHLDSTTVHEFWTDLDKFMSARGW